MINNMKPNLEKELCAVAIYLYGDYISIDDASRLFSLTPTKFKNKGDKRITSTGSEIVSKVGMWEHTITVARDDISKSVREILAGVEGDKILGRFGIEHAEIDIFFTFDHDEEFYGFSIKLDDESLRRMADLGLDLIITAR